jgi:hypothetical protein
MGKAEGIEVEEVDRAAWEAAMSSFRQAHRSTVRRQPTPMATRSLHALRLMSPFDRLRESAK